jgi:hypothetical protein
LAPLRVIRRDGRGRKSSQCTIGRVRRLIVGIAGALGAAAFWRRRRQKKAHELPAAGTGPDPAVELRAKLAESRATDDPAEEHDRISADPDAGPLDPETRRRTVHERARSSIDDLNT